MGMESQITTFLGSVEGNDDNPVNTYQNESYPIFTTHWYLRRLFFVFCKRDIAILDKPG